MAGAAAISEFLLREDAPEETIAPALHRATDPLNLDDVDAHAQHGNPPFLRDWRPQRHLDRRGTGNLANSGLRSNSQVEGLAGRTAWEHSVGTKPERPCVRFGRSGKGRRWRLFGHKGDPARKRDAGA
jgi:hypothetical protein